MLEYLKPALSAPVPTSKCCVSLMHHILPQHSRQVCLAGMQELGYVPIIAEDLGVITADVVELRENIGAPGMVVLQFAWGGGATNVHLPHNHYENSVVYPGVLAPLSSHF